MSISISNNPNKLLFKKKKSLIITKKKEKRIVITQLIFKIEQFNDLMNYNILGTRIQIRVLFIYFFHFLQVFTKEIFSIRVVFYN